MNLEKNRLSKLVLGLSSNRPHIAHIALGQQHN
jgi:hypothetical protein